MPANNESTRILVKLRPSAGLRAAESRAGVRPLFDTDTLGGDADATRPAAADAFGFATMGEPQWYLADLPDGAATPWDLAHARVADQLGVAESDVVLAEPDLIQPVNVDPFEEQVTGRAIGAKCTAEAQDGKGGQAKGPDTFAWHLGSGYSQLGNARDLVTFTDRRTRIAHFDTGYFPGHVTVPRHLRADLGRNFSDSPDPHHADDPGKRKLLLDNAGHGTGTLSILAGGAYPAEGGALMGGAPEAEVVPVRIASSVVLLRTSAFARALKYALAHDCDVVTMSMGGLPSGAWNDVINEAYLAGLCVVSAAGNNLGGAPTRHLVYPARYDRVIAACGVMADGKPYAKLQKFTMCGNHGPSSRMGSAIAAFTPNIPWAKFGCPDVVRLNGAGTSSATPQVAAAVALWFERYKGVLPRDWRRVEAVRHALFTTAVPPGKMRAYLGNGILRAADALRVRPRLDLPQTKPNKDSFAFLRVMTGLGVEAPTARETMFNTEVAHRWMLNDALATLVPDPEAAAALPEATLRKVLEALIEDPEASIALRRHLASRYPLVARRAVPSGTARKAPATVAPRAAPAVDATAKPRLSAPTHRRLRVYAVDPSLSERLDYARANDVRVRVRWETLAKGPVGEYIAVVDQDAAGVTHDAVDLNAPELLARDGWAPSEGNPQFHQQMVYAVAMRTVESFERALGRPVLWRARPVPNRPHDDSQYVPRLTIRPHALRQANAFYSPQHVALEFGYFEAGTDAPGEVMPGSRVFTCLSHDIIAHETTHAVLDGIYPRYNEPSNPDVLAFHEAFADIVALMQHFTIPEILEHEIARTRGDLEAESVLGSLAVQFGRATGGRGALRDAIGRIEGGTWTRIVPDPAELGRRVTPHARGAILVAAIFDAFLAIYRTRTADLLRLATGGSGRLPLGAIHPDLVRRLAEEASKSATHVLNICIRALDYLPPVDVTFFEYLRAMITADGDLVPDDRYQYRVAFVEAFRRRGIYPADLGSDVDTPRTLAPDTLRWMGLDAFALQPRTRTRIERHYAEMIGGLRAYAERCLYERDRQVLFETRREHRRTLHRQLKAAFSASKEFATWLGIDPARGVFEVHELRTALRSRPDGTQAPTMVVALTQQAVLAADAASGTPAYLFRGGATLVVDLVEGVVRYAIRKRFASPERRARTAELARQAAADPLLGLLYAMDRKEPFAALHALGEDGV